MNSEALVAQKRVRKMSRYIVRKRSYTKRNRNKLKGVDEAKNNSTDKDGYCLSSSDIPSLQKLGSQKKVSEGKFSLLIVIVRFDIPGDKSRKEVSCINPVKIRSTKKHKSRFSIIDKSANTGIVDLVYKNMGVKPSKTPMSKERFFII